MHPVLEKGDLKFGQFHNLHHLIQQNNGNNTHTSQHILQQPPTGRKKSSTLPPSQDGGDIGIGGSGGGDGSQTQDACHFIRVNSGRIELVSKDSWKTHSAATGSSSVGADQSGNYSLSQNATAADRFLNRHHLKNDVRHSWCGSAVRVSV